jgi:uncharacterized protein (TIGR02271 family)
MDAHGAVNMEERAAGWRESQRSEERSIPVVQEELQVGKRPVVRGGVRVYNTVREEPVEERVSLREEHVRVDRRRTDRPATEADIRGHDEVIEVTEMAEEPVVGRRTRVVEEVVVGKETTEHTATIRDTVRRSDVNVERTSGVDLEEDEIDERLDRQ